MDRAYSISFDARIVDHFSSCSISKQSEASVVHWQNIEYVKLMSMNSQDCLPCRNNHVKVRWDKAAFSRSIRLSFVSLLLQYSQIHEVRGHQYVFSSFEAHFYPLPQLRLNCGLESGRNILMLYNMILYPHCTIDKCHFTCDNFICM